MNTALSGWRQPVVRIICTAALGLGAMVFGPIGMHAAVAQEAYWIWAPDRTANEQSAGPCYFRKSFVLQSVDNGKAEITCDKQYTLYVNGVKIGSGDDWTKQDVYDIGPYLTRGRNVIAVAAVKSDPGPAGLIATIRINDQRGRIIDVSTNPTWKTSLSRQAGWQQSGFNDARWFAARTLGRSGATEPWIASKPRGEDDKKSRFEVTREFRVEWVIKPDAAKSLLAISFDEFGNLLASRENGPLLVIRDSNEDGIPDAVSTYCERVKNCQGILPMNGEVYVTGDGPEGVALYRLTDDDRDGTIDTVHTLVKFDGNMQEHGPHGLRLGPDGMIYMICGNMSRLLAPVGPTSPYAFSYEGDLVQPRYEDPRGHGRGTKAPGGTIVRTDVEGKHVERFAGGLRNPYDLVFDRHGELFTWDSDMEWDEGMTWYRPTRVNHVIAGAEFGWRSGWAKWPDYFVDSLPGVLDTGNGSPTGMVMYDHFMFPARFHGKLFAGDWAQGRIVAITPKKQGASYTAAATTFIEGNPLNVTDLAVGPDGWLYFCTGGRGTEGGVYRVVWTGTVPPEVKDLGQGIEVALRQPQFDAAWARQRIALVKKQQGDAWGPALLETARDKSAAARIRTRAVDLMQLYGPLPTTDLLLELAQDRDHLIRAKAAYLMGVHHSEDAAARLIEMLDDPDAVVRRRTSEALARGGYDLPVDKLIAMLGSEDRFLAWSAAKALQSTPHEHWQEDVLGSSNQRIILMGAVALLGSQPERETCITIVRRLQKMTKTFIADRDFVDLLRVCQVALHVGDLTPEDVPTLSDQLAAEFPAGNRVINRELLRILAYLESTEAAANVFKYFNTDLPSSDKMHLAMHAPHFIETWNTGQRFEMLEYYAAGRNQPGSPTYARYLDGAARDFVSRMTENERLAVLRDAEKWPHAALGAIAKLPKDPGTEALGQLRTLDGRLAPRKNDDAVDKLRTGIVAILARSGDAEALEYLRVMFDREPERRDVLALGLAQHPSEKSWPYLVRSLPVVEGNLAAEVIKVLDGINLAPLKPEPVRQVILHGLKQQHDAGRRAVNSLLERWTEAAVGSPDDSPSQLMARWQNWFHETYPAEPEAALPVQAEDDRYTFQQLFTFVSSDQGRAGDVKSGATVFRKAQCAKCHRVGDVGESIGPDLTSVSRRFQRKEILQSIVFPSHVISDQYGTKTVITTDGRSISGIINRTDKGDVVVLDSKGEQTSISSGDIDSIESDKVSSMPSGLLNELTMKEIADLFAFLLEPPADAISRRPKPSAR